MKAMQMNIRIGQELKEAGDSAFRRAGITPSKAVRLLWTFARDHAHEPEVIAKTLGAFEGSGEDAGAKRRRMAAARRGPSLVDDACKEIGISASAVAAASCDRDLRLDAYIDKASGRGVL